MMIIAVRMHISKVSDFPKVNTEKILTFKSDTFKEPVFLFLGNSITESFDLVKHFNKPYVNRGIGGNTTEAVLYRLDEVIEKKPQNIILMIGVNDISRGVVASETLLNYQEIIHRLQISLPQTVIYTLSVLPVRDSYNFRRFAINTMYSLSFIRPFNINPSIVRLNQKIEEISEKTGVKYLNLYNYFLQSENSNELDPELALDNVHLNEKGYELLAKLLKERVESI